MSFIAAELSRQLVMCPLSEIATFECNTFVIEERTHHAERHFIFELTHRMAVCGFIIYDALQSVNSSFSLSFEVLFSHGSCTKLRRLNFDECVHENNWVCSSTKVHALQKAYTYQHLKGWRLSHQSRNFANSYPETIFWHPLEIFTVEQAA